MRKFYTLLATLALVSTTLWGATNYGLKVGGVSITSDNCSNVTGSNIVAYNAGSEHFVKYDPNTKTLTLKNIKIERSGSYNRAILNDDVDGLTIVFIGGAYLAAKDASPVRLNNNTTITAQDSERVRFWGEEEDALTIGNGKKLIIDNIYLQANALNSTCIIGDEGSETVIINGGAMVETYTYASSSSEASIRDLGWLRVENSFLKLNNNGAGAVHSRNIKTFSYGGNYMGVVNGEYSSTNKAITHNKDLFGDDNALYITKHVFYNDTEYFNDDFGTLLTKMAATKTIYNKVLLLPNGLYAGKVDLWTSLDVSNKNLISLQGIEFLTDLKELNCSNNSLKSIDLSKNTALTNLNVANNQLTALNVENNSKLVNIDCSNNLISQLNLSKNIKLRTIACYKNQIFNSTNTKNGTYFVNNLPDLSKYISGSATIVFKHATEPDNNSLYTEEIVVANNKFWSLEYTDGKFYNGEGSGIKGIEVDDTEENAPRYNLQGQPVNDNYRGIVIQKGKKILVK